MDQKFKDKCLKILETLVRSEVPGEIEAARTGLRRSLAGRQRTITEVFGSAGTEERLRGELALAHAQLTVRTKELAYYKRQADVAERKLKEEAAEVQRLLRRVHRLENRPPLNAPANAARRGAAVEFAEDVTRHVRRLRLTEASVAEVTDGLNAAGVTTREGGAWTPRQVRRVLDWMGGSWSSSP